MCEVPISRLSTQNFPSRSNTASLSDEYSKYKKELPLHRISRDEDSLGNKISSLTNSTSKIVDNEKGSKRSKKRERDDILEFVNYICAFKKEKSVESDDSDEELDNILDEISFNFDTETDYSTDKLINFPRRDMTTSEREVFPEFCDRIKSLKYLSVRNKLISAMVKSRSISFQQAMKNYRLKAQLDKPTAELLKHIWLYLERYGFINSTRYFKMKTTDTVQELMNEVLSVGDRSFENVIHYDVPLSHKSARIAVVGAGISGLSAAKTLKDIGFNNIVVLESQLRIGGRVHSLTISDEILDMGTSVVQGTCGHSFESLLSKKSETDNLESGTNEEKTLPEGYRSIVNYLSKGVRIKRGCVVESISYGTNESQVLYFNNHGLLEVIHADIVIVTVPLGILKENIIEFSPPLPKSKIESIKKIGFETVNKVHLIFPHSVWIGNDDQIDVISDSKGKYFMFLSHGTASGRASVTAYFSGIYAYNLEQKSDVEIVKDIYETLKSQKGDHIPEPLYSVITRWHQNPNFRGSFSYFQPNSSLDDYKNIGEPIQDLVYFAGEHCNPDPRSRIVGAYESGKDVAHQIAMSLQLKWKTFFKTEHIDYLHPENWNPDKISTHFLEMLMISKEDLSKSQILKHVCLPKYSPPEYSTPSVAVLM